MQGVRSGACPDPGRDRVQHGREIAARRNVEQAKPTIEHRLERSRQACLVAEIDDMQFAARRQTPQRLLDHAAPGRNHRERIGDHDPVEAGLSKQRLGIEGRGVGLLQDDALRQARFGHRLPRGHQHLRRHVEAETGPPRIGPRDPDQVAAGATADLQDRPARRRREALDHPVASQQVELPAGVVDVPLMAVHRIHQAGRAAIGRRRAHAAAPGSR
ncbi:hypothetical protein BH10PSE8_BH10PSE8_10880 [soil metagenome]